MYEKNGCMIFLGEKGCGNVLNYEIFGISLFVSTLQLSADVYSQEARVSFI
ncbi:MAG: hypothetical protein ACLU4J_25665 [Butyricimonas paravirosa]